MIRGKSVGKITLSKPFQKCLFPSENCQYAIGSLKCRTCRNCPDPLSEVCQRVLPRRQTPIKLTKRKIRMPVSRPKPLNMREITIRKFKPKSATFIPTSNGRNTDQGKSKSKIITPMTKKHQKTNDGIFLKAQTSKSVTPEKGKRKTKKSSETISKEMESVTSIVKNLQVEVDNLKKQDCGFRNLVASIESNTMGDYNNNKLKAAVTMAFLDEDNAALKSEIEKLKEELEKGKSEVLKKGEEIKKKKAKLVAEITSLKNSIKEEVRLKEQKHAEYCEMRDNLRNQIKPSTNMWARYLCKSDNFDLRRQIERYDPTPPPPKPNPYKTKKHLELHKFKEYEITAYDRDASKFRNKFKKADEIFDKIDTCMKEQNKKNFILSSVLKDLTRLNSDVRFDYPINDNPDLEKMKDEVNALEISATIDAEKKYAEIERALPQKARNSRPLNSSNPPEGPAIPRKVILAPLRPNVPPQGPAVPHEVILEPLRPGVPPQGPAVPHEMNQGPPRPNDPPEGLAMPAILHEVIQGPLRPIDPQEGSSNGVQRNNLNVINFGASCSYSST